MGLPRLEDVVAVAVVVGGVRVGFFVVVVRFLFFTFETQRRVIISGERERERENNKWWKIMVTHRRAAR